MENVTKRRGEMIGGDGELKLQCKCSFITLFDSIILLYSIMTLEKLYVPLLSSIFRVLYINVCIEGREYLFNFICYSVADLIGRRRASCCLSPVFRKLPVHFPEKMGPLGTFASWAFSLKSATAVTLIYVGHRIFTCTYHLYLLCTCSLYYIHRRSVIYMIHIKTSKLYYT